MLQFWEGKYRMTQGYSQNANVIHLTGEKISLTLETTTGALSLTRTDGKIKFGPILFWAGFRPELEDKKFLFSTIVLPGKPRLLKDQETQIGKADILNWEIDFRNYRLGWGIAFFEQEEFVCFRVKLSNQSKEPIWVDELSPFSYRGAGDGLEMGAGYTVWKFFRLGYQSWSPSGSIGFLEPQKRARNFLAKRIGLAPYLWSRQSDSVFSSEYMAEIVEPELDLAFLLGAITSRDQTPVIEAEVKYERFRRLEMICDMEGIELAPGNELCSEWVLAMLSDTPRAAQKKYYELWAKTMNARAPKPVTGWCSWYYYFNKITLAQFEDNLKRAKEFNPKIELFQLDDGYERAVGDWLDWNERFPISPKELAEEIHAKGFKAGIWLAPFVASISSELYKNHPEWTLKNQDGWSVIGMINPMWEGKIAFALDPTHPEFQQWLKGLIEHLVKDCKFDFLKLDFLYAGALPGKRYAQNLTGAQALRKGLEIIRESAGENCLILGCGAPLGPSIGIVDIMRVSQDTERKWKNPLDFVMGISLSPSLKNCFKNNLARSLSAGRLWMLDPDCLLLSGAKGFNEVELKSQLVLFYLFSGQLFLSEELAGLNEGQKKLFSLAVPVSEHPAEPIDLFEREFPEQFFKRGDKMSLLAVANWSEQAKPLKVNLFRFGLNSKYHLFEAWDWNYYGEFEGKFELGEIQPHQVRYFALTQVSNQPQIIGLDFHLGMGAQGASIRKSSEGLSLELSLLGIRQGRVWIKFPDRKEPKILAVEFEDNLKIEI